MNGKRISQISINKGNAPMRREPTFLVIGAPKSGTTSLYAYLRQHPQIFLPTQKELHFFSYKDLASNCGGPGDKAALRQLCPDAATYLKHYAAVANEIAIGDISPSYLYYAQSAERIVSLLGKVKIIAMLRDPVAKAFSQYMHLIRENRETLSFGDALLAEESRVRDGWSDMWRYKESGFYAKRLECYLNTFGSDNVLVVFFEEFVKDTANVLQRIYGFLGVDPAVNVDTSGIFNRTGLPRNKAVSDFLANESVAKSLAKRIIPQGARMMLRQLVMEWNTGSKPAIPADIESDLRDAYIGDIAHLAALLNGPVTWGTAGDE